MRAHVENTASQIILAVAAAVSILIIGSECSAQGVGVGNQLWVTIYNNSGDQIGRGELELWSIRDGGEELVSTISMREIPVAEETWGSFPDPLQGGRPYRVIFRADWPGEPSKMIYFKSKSFVFRLFGNWKRIDIDHVHVVPRVTGGLIRFEVNKNPNVPPEIFAKPGDLIELDYTFVNVGNETIVPTGGAHPNVVGVSPIGPRPILVNNRAVSIASFFEAKSRGDDWVSIVVNGAQVDFIFGCDDHSRFAHLCRKNEVGQFSVNFILGTLVVPRRFGILVVMGSA